MTSRPRVTLRAVAEATNLHVSTVARVLNGTAQVTKETEERVRAAARRLGYIRNEYAASLRTQRTRILGVLVPTLTDYVLAAVYEGIQEAALDRGYRTFVTNTHDSAEQHIAGLDALLSWGVDGLIIGDARLDGNGLDSLVANDIPFVLVSRRSGGHPAVTCHDERGGELAAEHLLGMGRTRIAVLAGQPYASTCADRTEGFLRACAAAGHPVPEELVVHSGYDSRGGEQAMSEVLGLGRELDAVFAVNDVAAMGAAGVLRANGIGVGERIALVGFNDIPLASSLTVPLTTVRSPIREMGAAAVEELLARIDGGRARSRLLAPELVVRASSR
ncbi:LacI family transcriptional regulator [Allokutzneria sp. A3M-2-11 16]|uniref:LacI family DNA-binding transcriptional regulator n=1 Tax=Allokutzneria sp. A3M-2-11 16 TaxID=2962043 RepID=UPI0020B80121|nr:LacI family DNA-binding transcriptional regulator [Allokutzneria sp. A3M-2-11 16]MCP3803537.1 LacI family transcriptional regulator [Allokutzneria sp. A3M-2-11 16]